MARDASRALCPTLDAIEGLFALSCEELHALADEVDAGAGGSVASELAELIRAIVSEKIGASRSAT